MPSKLLQIGVFLPATPGYFSDVVMGMQEFARNEANWAVEFCHTLEIADASTRRWKPDGILVNCADGDWRPLLRRLKIPAVGVGGQVIPGLPSVLSDDAAIGALAAAHFIERGFSHFAYCGYAHLDWSLARESAFRRELVAAGRNSEAFFGEPGVLHTYHVTGRLARWLASLPRPVAVFACHDRVAMLLAHAAVHAELDVPEDVAILGVDNNPLECGFTTPALSSIMGSARRVGYQAAVLLDRMMARSTAAPARTMVAPAGVAVRGSTDVLASGDPDLEAALRYIDDHADEPIDVAQIAKATIVNRRMLERKFRALLHRTPRQHLLKIRIERAKRLLVETKQSTLDISLAAGFPSASKFSAVFHRETGLSPSAFRKLYGLASIGR